MPSLVEDRASGNLAGPVDEDEKNQDDRDMGPRTRVGRSESSVKDRASVCFPVWTPKNRHADERHNGST